MEILLIYLPLFTSPFQEEQRKGSFLRDYAGESALALHVVNHIILPISPQL